MTAHPENHGRDSERDASASAPWAPGALAELVVVDPHEAQGWRVRRHERLDFMFEERCDWIREYGRAGQLAVDGHGVSLTFDELDASTNRLARYLRLHGAGAGDRVALLFDDRVDAYVALLAVSKIGATCVPLDPDAPADRLAFVLADTSARFVLSRSHLPGRVAPARVLVGETAELIAIDEASALIREMSPQRLQPVERGDPADRVAYIVHIADASGWSEPVLVDHRAVCNAVRIASETFGIRGHRLYQGRPLFCGSGLVEVLMAWAAGATLVPAPDGPPLRGAALHAQLAERRVTALCTTPTLLSTLEADLPGLQLLVVSGEPCPPSLVARWQRRGRRVLSVYVPAGTTVPAAWSEARPDAPVTIGLPLPTYAIVVLDPDLPRALPRGKTGEIGVAGLGLACGYLDRSGAAFVEDFLGIPGNSGQRIFRTGDLGRVGSTGEIEYHGPLDWQAGSADAPINPTAIESVMLAAPGVASAAVTACRSGAGSPETIGYYTCSVELPATAEQAIWSRLRDQLPASSPPVRLHRVEALPLTADGRVDRAALAPSPAQEMNRLLAENARLQEQLHGPQATADAAEVTEPTDLATPTPLEPPPGQPPTAAETGTLTPDQITQPAPLPPTGAAPAAPTPDQLLAPPPIPPSPPTSSPPAPSPPSSAPRPSHAPAPRPSPVPRTPAPFPRRPTPFPRPPSSAQPTSAVSPADSAPEQVPPAPAVAVPRPVGQEAAPTGAPSPAGLAAALAGVLAEVLDVEHIPTDAHVFDVLGADSMVMTRFCARLRKRQDLPSISIKDVYAHPTLAALATVFAPSTPVRTPCTPGTAPSWDVGELAQILAEVLGVDNVAPNANVFDDLGADSMTMTRFCAQLRKRRDLPAIAIRDVYANPTIAGMAAATVPAGAAPSEPATSTSTSRSTTPVRHSTVGYLMTGLLQLVTFLLYATASGYVLDRIFVWISSAVGFVDVYLRSLEAGSGVFLAMALLPMAAKWVLLGRWKEREFPVWGLQYFRFWVVKTLVRANPLIFLIVGSPLYTGYLRALGATVGRNVVILTRHIPICTDLITIGAGTVVRKDAYLQGYRVHAGTLQQGPVTLGRDVVVGEKTVLDIGTTMGDGAQLGHASALHRGQMVPAGQSWHGSPAEPTDTDFRAVPPARVSALRKLTYVTSQLVKLFAIYLPLGFGGLFLLLTGVPRLRVLLDAGALGYTTTAFYVDALVGATVTFFGGLAVGLVIVLTVPRLVAPFVRPDRVYPLYGFRYSALRTVTRLTNLKTYVTLLGDSSFIVSYLYLLGYDLGKIEQTGSNFGSAVAQETPYLVSVGTGTVVADGLSVNNADFSTTSFRTARVRIGAHNFLGNHIPYPIGGRTGDDCLLATKVAIPIDGPVRQGVGLLGSPAFEIPRTVQRDKVLEVDERERRRRLHRKNRHNLLTLAFALVVRWAHVYGLLLLAMLAVDHYTDFGTLAFAAEVVASVLFTILWFVLWERLVIGFRGLRPKACSIYDIGFWRHERFWKLVVPPIERQLAGTPWKNLVSRMLGVRIGRRVFDDGVAMTERTLTTIGDDCCLNTGSIIQCHSQEDGAFKSDRTTLGAGVTLGVSALVHYGVTIEDAVEIEPDSFVMKGEQVPAGSRWGGNPAEELADARSVVPADEQHGPSMTGVAALIPQH
ncbi:Pls/PosA family non-ribosomal peptide synthetase [Pseudonocardia sp. NPDC049154]|uniref:Pls/PosA family non-ribosomal peptide synthetase n=1 Tax=Pseudonocardia sp. NPDC049154 TaxID=3155501 RepID=UPI0033D78F6A